MQVSKVIRHQAAFFRFSKVFFQARSVNSSALETAFSLFFPLTNFPAVESRGTVFFEVPFEAEFILLLAEFDLAIFSTSEIVLNCSPNSYFL